MTVIIYNSGRKAFFKLDLATMKYTHVYSTFTEAKNAEKYRFGPTSVTSFFNEWLSISNIPVETFLRTNYPELLL
jgi:hypothetical protein